MIELVISGVLLIIALFVLVRGADLFVEGAKQMGSALGMSKFAIGVLIVGFGTSLPELASAIAAALKGTTEIVIANAVGSNITNILLVVGVVTVLGGRIIIKHDLIKTELPIFFVATALFLLVVADGAIDRLEFTKAGRRPQLEVRSVVFIVLGIAAVLFGAKYAVDLVVAIATDLQVPIGLISITAIALGTSLPELFVSLQAVRKGEGELAIGNIFGSNAFNILVVIGLPGVLVVTPLLADEVVMQIGVPILLVASAIFFVNGLARQIMRWEGLTMLLFFLFFAVKLAQYCIDCFTAV